MWYSASLLFKGVRVSGSTSDPLWEESIRLIESDSEDQAREKAQQIGSADKTSFQTSDGAVEWVFDRVERIYDIRETALVDGVEIFSRFLRDSEVKSLLTPFEDE